jgi:hypothetical protein
MDSRIHGYASPRIGIFAGLDKLEVLCSECVFVCVSIERKILMIFCDCKSFSKVFELGY